MAAKLCRPTPRGAEEMESGGQERGRRQQSWRDVERGAAKCAPRQTSLVRAETAALSTIAYKLWVDRRYSCCCNLDHRGVARGCCSCCCRWHCRLEAFSTCAVPSRSFPVGCDRFDVAASRSSSGRSDRTFSMTFECEHTCGTVRNTVSSLWTLC